MMKSAFFKVMWLGKATMFLVGLSMMLAVVLGAATMALAGTGIGAPFNLGKTNTVNQISRLVGSVAGASLRIDNNSSNVSATALDLRVKSGKAPMKVNSATRVANLNADKVDNRHANELVRVASQTLDDSPVQGSDGTIATTTIEAPTNGFLVIDASSTAINIEELDRLGCVIELDNVQHTPSTRLVQLNGNADVNEQEICSTDTVVPVAAGTHTVDFESLSVTSIHTNFSQATVTAMFVPFNGFGSSPPEM